MTVLAIVAQKGGVAKTITTASLSTELASLGRRVLVIDFDPQSNLTIALGYDPTGIHTSVYEAILNPHQGMAAATITTAHGVDLVPATFALAGAEISLPPYGREQLLREALRPVREAYDFIFIDTPSNLGLLTASAMVAADALLVPIQAHPFSLFTMPYLEQTIAVIRPLNKGIQIGGIVVTMVDRRTNVSRDVEAEVRERYGDLVFATTIPDNTKLSEAPAAGQPISVYAPRSSGAAAYHSLAQEVLARYG